MKELMIEDARRGQRVTYQNLKGEWAESTVRSVQKEDNPPYIMLDDNDEAGDHVILDCGPYGWKRYRALDNNGKRYSPPTYVLAGWRSHHVLIQELGDDADVNDWVETLL